MIRVTITGRLGKDPELKSFSSANVCNFSVASNSFQKGEEVTSWRNISVWGKQADACMKFLKKGAFVIVTGEESDRRYEGGTSVDVRASHVEFGPKESMGAAAGRSSSASGSDDVPPPLSDDIPPPGDDDLPF
jgi:single-strand DNA-binding protein